MFSVALAIAGFGFGGGVWFRVGVSVVFFAVCCWVVSLLLSVVWFRL